VTRAFDLLISEEGETLAGEAELEIPGGSADFVF